MRNAGSLRVSVLIEALTRAQRLQTTGMYPPVQLSVFSTSDALIRTSTPGSPETIEGKVHGFASRGLLHARKLEFTVCGYVMWVFGLVECRSLRIRLARCVLRPLWSHSGLRCASTTLVGIDVCVLIENFECLCGSLYSDL